MLSLQSAKIMITMKKVFGPYKVKWMNGKHNTISIPMDAPKFCICVDKHVSTFLFFFVTHSLIIIIMIVFVCVCG